MVMVTSKTPMPKRGTKEYFTVKSNDSILLLPLVDPVSTGSNQMSDDVPLSLIPYDCGMDLRQ